MDRATKARTIQYNCIKTDGTGTAGPLLSPFFQAWGAARGIVLTPGTLNLCAHRDVVLPIDFVSLKSWDSALSLEWRKQTMGYDPRLYLVALNRTEPAWVFRWSDVSYLGNFVGDTPECVARRRLEVVAETNLSERLGLQEGSTTTVHFK